MLDAIDSKFKESNGFFEKLTHSTNPIITFQFLNLKDLKMTDDLYIKMNARGKSLSDYENFKAQFEKFIEINHSEYEKEFSDKIDGIWCDLFWDFSVNHPQKISYNIDTQILRFFDFITEMLYCLLQRTDEEAYDFNDFKIIEKTYTSEKNLLFLMRSLDLFSNFSQKNQKNNLDIFFKDIFSKEFEENKVCLFDNSTNLLEKLMYDEKSFDHKDKLLLFSLIYYQIASDSMKLTVTDNLKYFIRICRNFIFKINQKGNSTKKDEFLSDLRTYHYSDIIKTFILIFDKDNVYNSLRRKKEEFKFRIDNINEEIHKAEIINRDENNIKYIHKLEDHKYLRGDLHNFELLLSNKENIESLTEHFYTIWEDYTDSFIIKSLLSVGDYAIWIGGCYFGGLYFFGIKDKWHRIFADKDNSKKLKTIFKNYFENLQSLGNISVDDKLEKLISDGLLNPKGPDWIKLFLKYDTITETNHGIYSFRHDFEYNIDRIEGTSLKGFHINSFIHAVFESNNLTPKFSNRWWTTGAEENIITLKKSMSMQPLDDYWYINSMYNDISILIEEFNLEQIEGKKNKFKLFPTEKKDFVEIAIEFINRIYE